MGLEGGLGWCGEPWECVRPWDVVGMHRGGVGGLGEKFVGEAWGWCLRLWRYFRRTWGSLHAVYMVCGLGGAVHIVCGLAFMVVHFGCRLWALCV